MGFHKYTYNSLVSIIGDYINLGKHSFHLFLWITIFLFSILHTNWSVPALQYHYSVATTSWHSLVEIDLVFWLFIWKK
jgi:hypothetical protein